MFYVSHYEKYAIYEPAEGGYYYEGRELVGSKAYSTEAKALKALRKIKYKYLNENMRDYGTYTPDTNYCWTILDRSVDLRSRYIGEGEMWIIEKSKGENSKGYEPYC